MSSSIPFIFSSAPSSSSDFDVAMSCYECSMLGYGMTCQDCSRFTATMPMTPPSSPASDFAFSFDFPPSFGTNVPDLETPSTPDSFTHAIKQSCWNWPKLETTVFEEPSTKTSRFDWSEMDFSTEQHVFDTYTINFDDAHSSISDPESEFHSNCAVCSMVPYGALCTNCAQIQTSKAIILATPPAAAWPITHRLGHWKGTKAPEEELLRNLDMELFEQINVPHGLDEWGRRVYNDCGHRILYYQDSDGNTVMGYEAWYPSSVIGDYEEPDDLRDGRQIHDSAVDNEAQYAEYDDCGRRMDLQDHVPKIDFEQQRFSEFLSARDEELPQFQSDRERIAAWIATSSGADDDDVSILDHEPKEMVSEWYTDLEELESGSVSNIGALFCSDGSAEKGYVSVPLCGQ